MKQKGGLTVLVNCWEHSTVHLQLKDLKFKKLRLEFSNLKKVLFYYSR
jgi:hypothetical protein